MDGVSIGEILSEDPYLAYQPAFAYSLAIQLFANGITLTLLCVLMIHLLCQHFSVRMVSLRLTTCPSYDTIPLPLGPAQLHSAVPIHRHSHHLRHYQMHNRSKVMRGDWR